MTPVVGLARVPSPRQPIGINDLPTLFLPGPARSRRNPEPPATRATDTGLLARQVEALLNCPGLTDGARLAAINAITRAADTTPCPDWCTDCVSPDPGVVVHHSQPWTGVDEFDGTTWQVTVTQRVNNGVADPATVDVILGDGAFGSLTGFTADLRAAEAMKNRINRGNR